LAVYFGRRLPFLAVAVPLLLGSIGSANGLQKRMRGAGAGWRVLRRDLDALVARVAPKRALSVAPKALALLAEQPFPCNVRELRNPLERTTLMCDGERIEAQHVAQALNSGRRSHWQRATAAPSPALAEPNAPASAPGVAGPSLRELERAALHERVAAHQGSRAELAAVLGISERSLDRKLKALGL
jgi:DNA-binding NtrC family response regulator